ncbi:uncharacterized protein LOC116006746 [Ipomoea triloba]|uniref:uncharacterized protein LOC116006746 n=1 Tax=Ipomoea triloba TaxID=35885 RepID=UPI00125DB571|nr:uncharacterized protein LOC116006746 [Ipomoea triloba]
MLALGFAVQWVDLILLCVTSVSYNIQVNGASCGRVVPSHELRQGDPLSPYLFIICAEGLSLLLQKAQAEGSIHGCRVARGAPPISHLFFADDSLLFFKANAQEAGVIKHCLDAYESMSGQAVNYHKSSICFSRNTPESAREEVAGVLGVVQAQNFGKYLGLPNFVGRNKRAAFAYIEDKIKQRICSWNKRLLSQAGKEILLKSVAQAMPTFSMGVFLLPESVCLSIERTMNRYWWGSGAERGIHWKAWDRLCVPKKFGGLGFKDLRAFNLAMLGKQVWRFLTMPQSLVARVYKAKYQPRSSFIDATLGTCPSFCWRSIMAAHELVCGGVRRRIGNGKSTFIWGHPWLPDEVDPMIQTPMPPHLSGALVSGLMNEDTNAWEPSILTDIFEPSDVNRILRIPISPDYEDSWFWYGDPKGCYMVRGGYRCIVGEFENSPTSFDKWSPFWKIKVPPKWKTFLWRALSDILPVTTNLLLKRVEVDPSCPMCGFGHESVMHALVLCDFTQLVWHESHLAFSNILGDNFTLWFTNLLCSLPEDDVFLAVVILYHVWKARNDALWNGYLPTPRRVVASAAAALHAWSAINHVHQHFGRFADESADEEGAIQIAQVPLPSTPVCYFDAAYDPVTLKAAFGAVLLDPGGGFIAASAGPNRLLLSSYGRDHCLSAVASFSFFHIRLVPRTMNVIAHRLAVASVQQAYTLYWDSVPPDIVSDLLH